MNKFYNKAKRELAEKNTSPLLTDKYIETLLSARQETDTLDFKLDIDVQSPDFCKIVKDVICMTNGEEEADVVIGVDDDYNLVGYDPNIKNDEADVAAKIAKYTNQPVKIIFKEFLQKDYLNVEMKFAILHVFPSKEIVLPKQDGKWGKGPKEKVEFRVNDILVRSNGRSIKAGAFEFNQLIERRLHLKMEESQQFANEFTRYLGERAKALNTKETLVSNLFPLTKIPKEIYRGNTDLATKDRIFRFLEDIPVRLERVPRFVLREEKIMTFSNLKDGANPLRPVVNSDTIDTVATKDLMDDKDRYKWVISLLNSCLRKHCEQRGVRYHPDSERYYYAMTSGDKRRREAYTVGNRSYRRTVAKYDYSLEKTLVVHNAVHLDFMTLGQQIFLIVMPELVFTSDGTTVLSDSFTAKRSTQLLHNQYNDTILKAVRFWVSKINSPPDNLIRIKEFGFEIEVSSQSLQGGMLVGYNDEEDVLEVEESAMAEGEEEEADEVSFPEETSGAAEE
jgi:hypothetical protein